MRSYTKFWYKIFGDLIRKYKKYFPSIEKDLEIGGFRYTLEEYVSIAIGTIALTFFLEAVGFSIIFTILFKDILSAVMLSVTFSFLLTSIVMFLFYTYPAVIAKNKESEIDKLLPFAVPYMTSIASGNKEPIVIFKTLSKFDEYGKISQESAEIARNVDFFGMNIISAIKKQINKTPSKKWAEILWGIQTSVESGSDLFELLKQKSEELMSEHKRNLKKYSEKISLLIEIYLTLIIIGTIFFIVLSSIVSIISGGTTIALLQTFIVFIFLPLISFGFIILAKSLSPE